MLDQVGALEPREGGPWDQSHSRMWAWLRLAVPRCPGTGNHVFLSAQDTPGLRLLPRAVIRSTPFHSHKGPDLSDQVHCQPTYSPH